jgi:hypothetical protein
MGLHFLSLPPQTSPSTQPDEPWSWMQSCPCVGSGLQVPSILPMVGLTPSQYSPAGHIVGKASLQAAPDATLATQA